ncbi:ABC transporter ATP-binding protein [Ilumatobacter coccineus]|jgi:peptide/nickel transport system ATP-binding protein|uniref:Oligopeptide ABC transporter ATP-binding protein n=1 Tax=Ilumatobacter coccineus (strain NBRC 103263 / KCTC 29153 / YM16-304) TaxID=1313172 RepID=A0A6C7E5Y2_ILUCY|nr:oligopeptide/dipeptide ABC transporter ATP-binding protein [Ilumatobacter coccineus]BAN01910.1 oligopeptide ABC transporter ATP-binding protein [Ilumatobacter coccineus YM16-304]
MAGSGTAHLRDTDDVLVRVENMVVEFPISGGTVHAVSDVSFDLVEGETLGIVGESGCGKSTTARATIQLPKPTSGSVWFKGRDISKLSDEEMRRVRPEFQMIFQDPISSLNPRRTVTEIISEGLRVWGPNDSWSLDTVPELMESVGIDPRYGERKPHQFSGGQCQRISIARALVLDPKVIICDEPVSALDVSVQAQILNLLEDMKARYGVSLMFISHDLSVVKNISDRVMVMYMGKTCEIAGSDELFDKPVHHYTRALMAAIPGAEVNVEEQTLDGELPSAINPPAGCRFNTRCPAATDRCRTEEPQITEVSVNHYVACHHPVLG